MLNLVVTLIFFIFLSMAVTIGELRYSFEKQEKVIYKPIEKKLLLSLAQDARFKAKILKINEDTVEIYSNQVFFLTNANDLCRQTITKSPEKYVVHTLCFRNNTILIEYISDFKRF